MLQIAIPWQMTLESCSYSSSGITRVSVTIMSDLSIQRPEGVLILHDPVLFQTPLDIDSSGQILHHDVHVWHQVRVSSLLALDG